MAAVYVPDLMVPGTSPEVSLVQVVVRERMWLEQLVDLDHRQYLEVQMVDLSLMALRLDLWVQMARWEGHSAVLD